MAGIIEAAGAVAGTAGGIAGAADTGSNRNTRCTLVMRSYSSCSQPHATWFLVVIVRHSTSYIRFCHQSDCLVQESELISKAQYTDCYRHAIQTCNSRHAIRTCVFLTCR